MDSEKESIFLAAKVLTDTLLEPIYQLGHDTVAGIDEVGRGCLAGPVTAAAVVLPRGIKIPGVRDSKLLSRLQRERLAIEIKRQALGVGLGWSSPAEIDQHGLTWAVRQSGLRALDGLGLKCQAVMLDGKHNYLRDHYYSEVVVGADNLVLSVAAASIVAKVARDRYMLRQHHRWPQYEFSHNVGYATRRHLAAMADGLSSIHRQRFAPVAARLNAGVQIEFFEQLWGRQ